MCIGDAAAMISLLACLPVFQINDKTGFERNVGTDLSLSMIFCVCVFGLAWCSLRSWCSGPPLRGLVTNTGFQYRAVNRLYIKKKIVVCVCFVGQSWQHYTFIKGNCEHDMMMVVADIAQWCCASSGGRGIQATASNTPCDSMYNPDMADFERMHTHTHNRPSTRLKRHRNASRSNDAPSTLPTNAAQCASKATSNIASWTW